MSITVLLLASVLTILISATLPIQVSHQVSDELMFSVVYRGIQNSEIEPSLLTFYAVRFCPA